MRLERLVVADRGRVGGGVGGELGFCLGDVGAVDEVGDEFFALFEEIVPCAFVVEFVFAAV